MNPSDRSLEIVAVGLGQAGGNLAAEFHRRGYRGLAFNTARTDLTSISTGRLVLPESQRIYIGLEGTDGAGSDVAYGQECIAEHAAEIREAVEEHAVGADVVVLSAGLGGGTGSCLGAFKAILDDLSLPIVILTTLPHHHESGIAKVNALRGIRDLAETPSYGWVLIDNAKLARFHQDTPIDSYFETINREIVEPLDVFNRLNDRDSARAIRTLDGEDFRSLLLSGGVLNYHTQVLPKLSASAVLECVRDALDENPMMPAGTELANIAYLGLVIEASERALATSPFSIYEEIANHLKDETGGAAVYIGLYRQLASDTNQAMVRFISSSRSLPGSIGEILAEAKREASTIHHKVQQDVQSLDLGGLEELRLRRRPIPRGPRAQGRARAPTRASEPKPTVETPRPPVAPTERAAVPAAQGKDVAGVGLAHAVGILKAPPAMAPQVATGDASAAATPEPGVPAAASSTRAKNFRARYARLLTDFRSAKTEEQRVYVARELVAAQRSSEPLERFYSVHVMTRIDPAFFRDALADAAKDSDAHIAHLARQALDRLAGAS